MKLGGTSIQHKFVGREDQLKTLNTHLLQPLPFDEKRCVFIYGPKACGKSAFVNAHLMTISRATSPFVWGCYHFNEDDEDEANFLETVVNGLKSNWPELEPFLAAFSNSTFDVSHEGRILQFKDFASQMEEHFIQPEHQEIHPELNELKFEIIVEAIDQLPEAILRNLKALRMALVGSADFQRRTQFVFTATHKNKAGEAMKYLFSGTVFENEILIPPFAIGESKMLLEQFGIEPSKHEQIHLDAAGIPGALLHYCQNALNIQTDESADLERAESILGRLAPEQQEWLKIAALLGECDAEKMSLFLSEEQSALASAWLCAQSTEYLRVQRSVPTMQHRIREILVAYQKKENPGKFQKRMKRVKNLECVRKVIPKHMHRTLLSKLHIFNYFDRRVLEAVHGGIFAQHCWDLIEQKTAFFTVADPNVRLSHNTRIMMGLYQQLFPLKGQSELTTKIKGVWEKRLAEIKAEILTQGKVIETNESVREEVSKSIDAIDKRIQQASSSFSKVRTNQADTVVKIQNLGPILSHCCFRSRVSLPCTLECFIGMILWFPS